MSTLKILALVGTVAGSLGFAPIHNEVDRSVSLLTQPESNFDTNAIETAVVWLEIRRYTDGRWMSWNSTTGTGVMLSDGRLLTAKHLFESGWDEVYLHFGGNGNERRTVRWSAGSLRQWDSLDLAMLTGVDAPAWVRPVTIAASTPKIGDLAMSYGRPEQGGVRVRVGMVTEYDHMNLLYLDFNSSNGDSGGPTFNNRMELVGIHSGSGESRSWSATGGERRKQYSYSVNVTNLNL